MFNFNSDKIPLNEKFHKAGNLIFMSPRDKKVI